MPISAFAQELIVLEPVSAPMGDMLPLEVAEPDSPPANFTPLDVKEPGEIAIVIGDLPGAPDGTPEPEILEIVDDEDDKKKEDEDKAKAAPGKWDWSSRGAKGFIAWVKERFDDVPKHNGVDTAGCERARAYLEKLDDEISKAMRLDLDGDLDADQIEKIRAKIEEGVSKLQDRIDKIKQSKKSKNRKKRADEDHELIKEGQKITGMKGVMITVPLFISAIGRTLINGTVSGGRDIEASYHELVKKWKLNDREQMEVRQFIDDCGFPLQRDRGLDPGHFDPTNEETALDRGVIYPG